MPSVRFSISMTVLLIGALFTVTTSSLEFRNKLMKNLGARSLASTHSESASLYEDSHSL